MNNILIKIVILFVFCTTVNATEVGFKVGKSQHKLFVVERIIEFKEVQYKDIEIDFLDKAVIGNKGPDKELVSMLSAKKKLNYDWWFNIWNDKSKKIIKQLDRTNSLKEARINKWKNLFINDLHLYLDKWIELENAVIISYELRNQLQKVVERKSVLFRIKDGKWYADLTINSKLLNAIDSGSDLEDLIIR